LRTSDGSPLRSADCPDAVLCRSMVACPFGQTGTVKY
jgi:hypothetical protein